MYIITRQINGKEMFWTGKMPELILQDQGLEKWTNDTDLTKTYKEKIFAEIDNQNYKLEGSIKHINQSREKFK